MANPNALNNNNDQSNSAYDQWVNMAVNRATIESQQKVKALNEDLDAKRQDAAIERQDLESAVEQAALPAHETQAALPPHEEAVAALPPHEEALAKSETLTKSETLERTPDIIAYEDLINRGQEMEGDLNQQLNSNQISQEEFNSKLGALNYYGISEFRALTELYPELLDKIPGARERVESLNRHEAEVKARSDGETKDENEALALEEDNEKARGEGEQKARDEGEQKQKEEEEAKQKEEEEKEVKKATKEELEKELAEIEAKLAKNNKPLVAINADFTHDMKEIAHDVAKTTFDEKTAKVNFIRKIWRNTFDKAYIAHYEKQFMRGELKDQNGRTIDERIAAQRAATMERFTLGATESMEYIHTEIGEDNKNKSKGNHAETLDEADAETTAKVRSEIEAFFKEYKDKAPNMSDADLIREFNNMFGYTEASARDEGNSQNQQKLVNNYGEVALNALKSYSHFEGLQAAMKGFKVYNADVRNNVRTEAHRDNIDKIVNALSDNKFSRYVPTEIIAAAAGLSTFLTRTGARAIGGAAGGLAVSSIIAGLRERNRITEDRTQMLRNQAYGMEYTSETEETGNAMVDRRLRKSAKYEAKIGGTLYPLEKATDLTKSIEDALALPADDAGRADAIKAALREARVRITFSDRSEKDLIAYSSADNCGQERLDLDKAVIRARAALSEDDRNDLATMESHLMEQIASDYNERDDAFARERALRAAAKAGKTLGAGVLSYFISQEVVAAFDPNKVGLFEKLFKTNNNNPEASEETIAASLLHGRGTYNTVTNEYTTDPSYLEEGSPTAKLLEEQGYQKTLFKEAIPGTKSETVSVNPADSPAAIKVKYDGWANNGTRVSDGNELRAHIIDGKFVSTMRGSSTLNGQPLPSYEDLAMTDRIKAYITIGGAKFEVAGAVENGQLTWGENGVFDVIGPDGQLSTIRGIGENGEKLYKYFEIAMDNGSADGVQHIVPLATDIGRNSFTGTMDQIIPGVAETPAIYEYTKTIKDTAAELRNIWRGGVAFAQTSRTGLGTARPTATEAAPASEPEQSPIPTPEGAPAPTPEQSAPNTPAGQAAVRENLDQTPPSAPETPETPVAPTANEAPRVVTRNVNPTTTVRYVTGTPFESVFGGSETGPGAAPEQQGDQSSADLYRAAVRGSGLTTTVINLFTSEGGDNIYGPEENYKNQLLYEANLGTPEQRRAALNLANRLNADPDLPFDRSFANWLTRYAAANPDQFAPEAEPATPEAPAASIESQNTPPAWADRNAWL